MSSPEVLSNRDQQILQAEQNCTPNSTDECCDFSDGAPAWLTRDYLQSCLRSYYKDDKLQILQYQAKPALGKGENYGGVLTRVRAEFSTKSGSMHSGHYIVKTSFEGDEFSCEKMAPYDIFNREIEIYEQVLPKLKALLKECGDEEQIFAETMCVDRAKSALVFEDLNERQFLMPDRLKGLDMETTKIVLRKLAKMHACSAVLNEREPKSLEHYDKGMLNRYTDNYAPCFVGMLEACARRVGQWQGFEAITEKLKALCPHFMELGKRVFDPLSSHLNVFAHGDMWTNNVLVKYDEKTRQPLDVIIIDFQYSVWSSPAVDLFYLFNTSLSEEMHLHRQDELIQHYYHYLRETLEKLKFSGHIPSLHEFHLQMQEKSFYALHCTCTVQAIQRNTVTDDADFQALMKTDERARRFKDTCMQNPYIQGILRKLLPVYERRGLLEVDL